MKKCLVVFLLIMAPFIMAKNRYNQDFMASDVTSIAADTTATNGSDFNSRAINISSYGEVGTVQVWFTRASSTGYTIEFHFQVSLDDGTTWNTYRYFLVSVTISSDASSSIVSATVPVNLSGVSHIRLYKIVNLDPANGITLANAKIGLQ